MIKTRNSIKFKVALGIFVLITAITILLSVVNYTYEKRTIENHIYEQLNVIADLKKKIINRYLDERIADLKSFAAPDTMKKSVLILLDPQRNSQAKEEAFRDIHRTITLQKNAYEAYLCLEIVDLNGTPLVSSQDNRKGSSRRSYQEYQPTLPKYVETFKRNAYLILQDHIKEKHLDLATGIQDERGKTRAVFISKIDLPESIFPLFSDYTSLGRTGETLLVRRQGSQISFINPTRHPLQTNDPLTFNNEEYLKLPTLATRGNEGIDQGIDYRGEKVIGAYRYISRLGWGIVAKIDTEEAFAEIAKLGKKTALLAVIILATMLVIVYVMMQRFLSPIDRLIESTKAITAGDYTLLTKSERNDEIGDLEKNFNQMVTSLETAWRLAEIRQDDLENKVKDRTENLAKANAALAKTLEDVQKENAEKKILQSQLLHFQKMEAIGTLAGGIAHDFNNMLTSVIGYSNLIKMQLKENDPLLDYMNQILAASERTASLTRSLLAFSRKQIINPQPLNLNDNIQGLLKLLEPLLGEHIIIRGTFSDVDPTVLADSGQLEQVLMNLATNARDAMPEGGTLFITTSIAEIDEQYIALHGYGSVGKYALITVSDTGTGMDKQTQARIFEPFFTTKETGKGTGLGLSIVYGVIKAQNGYINCYSEPGNGTTFKLYLPSVRVEETVQDTSETLPSSGGQETILVAEDNADVRRLVRTVLTEFGYTVIEAVNGEDAVKKFKEHQEAIQLLLFDVIMPKRSGKDAYEDIRKIRPDIKVIFTSGYTEDIIRQRAFLDEGLTLLMKPLSPRGLLHSIREVLDRT